jgi:transposase InsO family protein
MGARLVQELAADGVPVALTCRVLGISRSGLYEAVDRAPSIPAIADQALTATITAIHHGSRATYGAPRVHTELRLGLGIACGRKRVARLMRAAGLVGVCHRRKHRGARPLPAPHEDLVQRKFSADRPDRLWCTDITEHPTSTGKVYCAAVLDVLTRKIVGWSIADHMRSELVVGALQMAIWRRHPVPGTIVHADRGSQYASWIFGHRLREAGPCSPASLQLQHPTEPFRLDDWCEAENPRCTPRCDESPPTCRVGGLPSLSLLLELRASDHRSWSARGISR